MTHNLENNGNRTRAESTSHSTVGDDNKARILVAAEDVFAIYGYNGGTLDMIARKASLSKPNVLYYFRSKNEIYVAVLLSILDDWIEKMTLFEQEGNDPASKLEAYIRGKIEFSRTRPSASRVFANEIISGAPHLSDHLKSRLAPQLQKDVALVRQWIQAGQIDPIDPYHLFFTIWAATQTYSDFSSQILILLNKPELDDYDFETATDFLLHLILKGVGLEPNSLGR